MPACVFAKEIPVLYLFIVYVENVFMDVHVNIYIYICSRCVVANVRHLLAVVIVFSL